MIHKHEIPILEFDNNPQAVIMPNHEGLDLQLPKKCIYAFLEEEIDRYAQETVLFGLVIVEKRAQAKRAAERAGASIAAQEPR